MSWFAAQDLIDWLRAFLSKYLQIMHFYFTDLANVPAYSFQNPFIQNLERVSSTLECFWPCACSMSNLVYLELLGRCLMWKELNDAYVNRHARFRFHQHMELVFWTFPWLWLLIPGCLTIITMTRLPTETASHIWSLPVPILLQYELLEQSSPSDSLNAYT